MTTPPAAPEQPSAATPHSGYLDRLMRRDSFQALWPLFRHADQPAKEMTESFAALAHLRPLLPPSGPFRVVHVGDGAHARTAALFALKTRAENIAVDPALNEPLVAAWQQRHHIERFDWRKAAIEHVVDELNALAVMPVFVTFVHAHVPVDRVLDRLRWTASFSLVCCVPGHQLSQDRRPTAAGSDPGVLSPHRRWELLEHRST